MYPPISPFPALFDDPERHPQETAFLREIMAGPDDDAPRLIFADWLEDNAQPAKAQFVRLEIELSRTPSSVERHAWLIKELDRLDEAIGSYWAWALVRPGRLLNCGSAPLRPAAVRFAYDCPNRWVDLRSTGDDAVRYCEQCRKKVHYCESKADADRHALRGDCIAISSRLALDVDSEHRRGADLDVIGMPLSEYDVWAQALFERHGKRWWQFWR